MPGIQVGKRPLASSSGRSCQYHKAGKGAHNQSTEVTRDLLTCVERQVKK